MDVPNKHHLGSIPQNGEARVRSRDCYRKHKLRSFEVEFLGKVATGQSHDPHRMCICPSSPSSYSLSALVLPSKQVFCSVSLGPSAPQTLSVIVGFIAFACTKGRNGGLPPGSLLLRTLHSHWKQFPEFTGRRRGTVGVEVKPFARSGSFPMRK